MPVLPDTYQVHNFAEVNLDCAEVEIFVGCRVMDELGELALAHLRCTITKDE